MKIRDSPSLQLIEERKSADFKMHEDSELLLRNFKLINEKFNHSQLEEVKQQ